MNLLLYILFFSFLGSVGSLIGGVFLLWKRKLTEKISHLLISFAAGVLLGAAFFDLIPEASNDSSLSPVLFFTLVGFLGFFIFERFIHWTHASSNLGKGERRTVELIILGGSTHKAVDGAAIAATFLVSIPLGIVTSLAVAAHEIPREIGDFAVMLKRGLAPKKVFLFNFLSALAALIGATIMFAFGSVLQNYLPILLSITAGFFIYISASALIPEIHEKARGDFAFLEISCLILGTSVVWFLVDLLER